jgi:hypothetical protein
VKDSSVQIPFLQWFFHGPHYVVQNTAEAIIFACHTLISLGAWERHEKRSNPLMIPSDYQAGRVPSPPHSSTESNHIALYCASCNIHDKAKPQKKIVPKFRSDVSIFRATMRFGDFSDGESSRDAPGHFW